MAWDIPNVYVPSAALTPIGPCRLAATAHINYYILFAFGLT
jgi:hypothetical protein